MAGGETSGSAMASIVYFVLKNPEVHHKLKEEVRTAFVSYTEIDVTSTAKLAYLIAVLKEGMRIFPTAPQGTPRASPGMIVEGHHIPPGVRCSAMRRYEMLTMTNIQAEVYVSPWAVTHDPRFWREPYAFRPERWLDPTCTDDRSASQPFSLGPRVCPGKL